MAGLAPSTFHCNHVEDVASKLDCDHPKDVLVARELRAPSKARELPIVRVWEDKETMTILRDNDMVNSKNSGARSTPPKIHLNPPQKLFLSRKYS